MAGTTPRGRETLDLPPAFRLVTLREVGDAFPHAQTIAAEAGAGTLVWARRFDLADFAIVLEPDEPLAIARRAFCVGMAAVAEAIASHCPAGIPVAIDWPGTLRFDRSLVGGGRLAWPAGAPEGEPPAWLVFGVTLRLHAMKEIEPGLHTLGASLFDAGFDDADSGLLIESFARHLLALTDLWSRDGFSAAGRNYVRWLSPSASGCWILHENGDVEAGGSRRRLDSALTGEPSWRDPETGEPKL